MPSKYGFSTEERDARMRAEQARRAEEKKLAEEENRRLAAFLARPVVPETARPERTKEERRGSILNLVYKITDDFRRASESDFNFRECRVEWAGDDPLVHLAAHKDDWYKLSSNQQDQLLKTLAKHTRAKVTVRIDGWHPVSAALFDQ